MICSRPPQVFRKFCSSASRFDVCRDHRSYPVETSVLVPTTPKSSNPRRNDLKGSPLKTQDAISAVGPRMPYRCYFPKQTPLKKHGGNGLPSEHLTLMSQHKVESSSVSLVPQLPSFHLKQIGDFQVAVEGQTSTDGDYGDSHELGPSPIHHTDILGHVHPPFWQHAHFSKTLHRALTWSRW